MTYVNFILLIELSISEILYSVMLCQLMLNYFKTRFDA